MTLAYEGMSLEAEPGLTFTAYTAEPASESDDRIRRLAAWAESAYGEARRSAANAKAEQKK